MTFCSRWVQRVVVRARVVARGHVNVEGAARTSKARDGLGRELVRPPRRRFCPCTPGRGRRARAGLSVRYSPSSWIASSRRVHDVDFLFSLSRTFAEQRDERRDVDQSLEMRHVVGRFEDHGAAVTVSHQDDRSFELRDLRRLRARRRRETCWDARRGSTTAGRPPSRAPRGASVPAPTSRHTPRATPSSVHQYVGRLSPSDPLAREVRAIFP